MTIILKTAILMTTILMPIIQRMKIIFRKIILYKSIRMNTTQMLMHKITFIQNRLMTKQINQLYMKMG